ncbi:MAG: hypothetical protein E7536_02990 [Ruminococcaceae bacterium]|nr:hypothetical protein [Oscillospiraceae bacterium]
MIEYLYDAIRATAGLDIAITANITDDEGAPITEGCSLMLSDDNTDITMATGYYDGEIWEFNIPASSTVGLSGRYWYCIYYNDNTLCFKKPIYLM